MIIEPALERIFPDGIVPVTRRVPGESATASAGESTLINEPVLERISPEEIVPVTGQVPGESATASTGRSKIDDAVSTAGAGVRAAALHLDLKRLGGVGITYSVEQEVLKRREYRGICRQLLANLERSSNRRPKSGRRLVAVTSALPGEGKTYTSFNVARSIAELNDLPVILVDGDLVRRTLSVEFGAADSSGVAEFLRGDVLDLESLIHPTNIPRLAILQCGEAGGEEQALMSPSRLQKLAAELGGNEDDGIVVFDCPPVLASDDAAQLAGIVDQVLFVVRAAETLVDTVRGAIERLEAADKVVLLLNGWAAKHVDYEYPGQYRKREIP